MTDQEELEVGFWTFTAHVEVRPQRRFAPHEPTVETGDLWYRVVLGIDGMRGVFGELSTAWLESVEEAAEQAKTLRGFLLAWGELDEVADDYVEKTGQADLSGLIDRAVKRFDLVLPGKIAPNLDPEV